MTVVTLKKGKGGNKKNEWFAEMDIEEIKTKFEIDENAYKNRNDRLATKAIKDPINELNEINEEFKTKIEKITSGRRIEKYRFVCTELKPTRAKTNEEKDEENALKIIEQGEINRQMIKLTDAQQKAEDEKQFLENYYKAHKEAIEEMKKQCAKMLGETENLYNLRLANILAKQKGDKPNFN